MKNISRKKPCIIPTSYSSSLFHLRKLKVNAVIRAGIGESQRIFHIESVILCKRSIFLRASLTQSLVLSGPQEVDLPNENPTAVEMFIEWAKKPKRPTIYAPGQYSEEPWISYAAAAWMLGHHLAAAAFQKYALSQFIQNCALAAQGPWRLIEEQSPAQSSLLRFSNHWVAWNSSLSGTDVNEYAGLKAAKLAGLVCASTRDPRTFDLDHWYLDCGDDINAACSHDPILREKRRQKDRISKKAPPPEWGAEFEKR